MDSLDELLFRLSFPVPKARKKYERRQAFWLKYFSFQVRPDRFLAGPKAVPRVKGASSYVVLCVIA
jgi:hypothetical protein